MSSAASTWTKAPWQAAAVWNRAAALQLRAELFDIELKARIDWEREANGRQRKMEVIMKMKERELLRP